MRDRSLIRARHTIVLGIALILLLGLHPGGKDVDGCHYCQTNCAKWGVSPGERHCHNDGSTRPQKPAKPTPKKPAKPPLRHMDRVYVVKVKDGDTLRARKGEHFYDVRVQGIDCPESKKNGKCMKAGEKACETQIPKGRAAGRHAAKILKQKVVTLEATQGQGELERGYYRRPLAYVRLGDGSDFGLRMVVETACRDYGHKYPHPRSAQYVAAQNQAEAGQ